MSSTKALRDLPSPQGAEPETPGSSTTLHAHGDGTYHTIDNEYGKRIDHPSIGAALLHMARRHSTDDHVHIHAHEDGYTVHHLHEGGKVQGPHEKKTLGEVKRHVAKVLDEEGEEE